MAIHSLIPTGYLSTSGSQIVDSAGADVRIASIGWNENFSNVPASVASMAADGFNTIRIAWVDASLPSDLAQIEAVVAAAAANGMKVIIDHHTDEAGTAGDGYGAQQQNGLWYDSGPGTNDTNGAGVTGTVTAAQFQADWLTVAKTFAGNSTVIGFDLDNEPFVSASTGATEVNWGQGGPTDIRAMYDTVGSAVEAADPGALIIAEGPQNWTGTLLDGQTGLATEGDLSDATAKPVTLTVNSQAVADKVVYSVHEYPSTIGGETIDSGAAYIQQMNAAWGYLEADGVAPVWIGEMGASLDGTADSAGAGLADEQAWASTLLGYMNGQDGAQGGPTFSGSQQGVSGDWWNWGYNPGQKPDGILNANGSLNAAQQAVWSQLLPTVTASASATLLLAGSSGAIIDASGNTWTITAGAQVGVNGIADKTTASVIELAYVNGTVWQENAAGLWWGETAPTATWAPLAGTATSPLPVTVATGPTPTDTLVLDISEDAYLGNATFTVTVNGIQIGGTLSASASHSAGLDTAVTLTGNFGAGPTVVVTFTNDLNAGVGEDRNLYVDGMTYQGVKQTAAAPLYSDGSAAFALHGTEQGSAIPHATLSLTDDTGATATLAVITSGSQVTLGGSQIALAGNIRQNIDSVGVANISTDTFGSGVVAVSMQDTTGASYHFSNFLTTNLALSGASTKSMVSGAALSIDGAAGGNVTFGSGDYNVAIAAEGDPTGTAAQNQFTITIGGTANKNFLHVNDTGTHGLSTNVIHAGAGIDQMEFLGAESTTVYGGSGTTSATCDSGTNAFIAGTGTMIVAAGTSVASLIFHVGDGLLRAYDFSLSRGDSLTVDAALSGAVTEASDGQGGLMITLGAAGHGVDLVGVSSLAVSQIHFV